MESDRCYFQYTLDPPAPNMEFVVGANEPSTQINFTITKPSPNEIKLFSSSHPICKTEDCDTEDQWRLKKLFATTDLNNNGKREFWFTHLDGYRTWTTSEEYDPSTKKWNEIFFF